GAGAVTYAGTTIDTTNDGIRFDGAVTFSDDIVINAGSGTFAANSTIAAGANNLTINADEIDFGGTVSGTSPLTLTGGQAGTTIGIAGGVGTLDLSVADLKQLQDGFTQLNIGD